MASLQLIAALHADLNAHKKNTLGILLIVPGGGLRAGGWPTGGILQQASGLLQGRGGQGQGSCKHGGLADEDRDKWIETSGVTRASPRAQTH